MPRCIMIPLATQKGSSVSIYNANKGCENIFTVGAGIPNAFKIPMVVAPCSVFQWCSVLNKMAAILLDFQWFGFRMVGTIALAIAITENSNTEPLEIRTSKRSVFQCFWYSNFWYSSPHCIILNESVPQSTLFYSFNAQLDLCKTLCGGHSVF